MNKENTTPSKIRDTVENTLGIGSELLVKTESGYSITLPGEVCYKETTDDDTIIAITTGEEVPALVIETISQSNGVHSWKINIDNQRDYSHVDSKGEVVEIQVTGGPLPIIDSSNYESGEAMEYIVNNSSFLQEF